MSAFARCQLIGHWRIVEIDLWDRDYLDLCGQAAITIGVDGRGGIALSAVQATLGIEKSRASVRFTWIGSLT
jgi:hypothetical protein